MLMGFYLTLVSPPTKLIQGIRAFPIEKMESYMKLDPNCIKMQTNLYDYNEEELADMIYYNSEEKILENSEINKKRYRKIKSKLI